MTTTREEKLEAALKTADLTIKSLLEVMATPDMQQCCDGRMCGCMGSTIYQEAEHYARQDIALIDAALSTPATETQSAADTRVVTVAQLERWREEWAQTLTLAQRGGGHGLAFDDDRRALDEIRTIIGTATPAPSDKIAEAARIINAYDAANPFRTADMHPALCHCNRCAIDWLRELAGKGE